MRKEEDKTFNIEEEEEENDEDNPIPMQDFKHSALV